MTDGNLETSGIQLIAEGADKYVNDLGKSGKAGQDYGKATADAIAKLAGTRDIVADLEIEIKGLQGALANAAKANDWEKFAQDSIKLRVAKENLAAYVKELKGLKDASQGGTGNAGTKGIANLGSASDASGKKIVLLGLAVSRLFSQIASGNANFSTLASSISQIVREGSSLSASLSKVTSGAGQAGGAISALGVAGNVAGAGVTAGMAVAIAAIATVIAAAGAAVLAVLAIGHAVRTAVALGSDIRGIQDTTGASADVAGRIVGASRVTGTPLGSISSSLIGLDSQLESIGNKADKSFGSMAKATEKADTQLARLNEDYARSVAEITTSGAERIQESQERLVESHASMLARQSRADEDYAREVADGREALAQRLADIDASANESIASLTQRQTRATEDYARETETARQDLAQSIFDIEQGLADSVEQLRYNAAQTNTSAIESGAKAQAKIQEDLQSKLASIEEKYANKRQDIQEKIYNPNTNPILRAFYKTQLKSLAGLQKAEVAGARAGASAKEAAARRETEALLAETARRLARETALEQQQAQRRIAAQQREATQRQAERLREFTQQSGDLQSQIGRENAQRAQQSERARADQAAREADLKRSYDRQTNDAKAAYDKQVIDATVAQAKIAAETQKRLDAEKRQFDRALEDIATALKNAAEGAGGAAAALTPLERALTTLGISAQDFANLSVDEKLNLIGKKARELIANGDLEGARKLLIDIFGPTVGGQMLRFVQKFQDTEGLGITQKDIDDLQKFQDGINDIKFQIELLVAKIGIAFLPMFQTFIDKMKEFWEKHGPEVTAAIKEIGKWVVADAIPAFLEFGKGVANFVTGFVAAAKSVDEKCRAISKAISQTGIDIHNVAVGIYNSLFQFGVKIFDVVKTKIDEVIRFIGTLKTEIDRFITSLGNIRLPSWLNPSGTGLTANVNFPPPPTFYGLPPSSPFGTRSQSVPATGAQMAAGNVTSNKTTNTNTASVNVVINGNASKSIVESGVSSALFKAGFSVVR